MEASGGKYYCTWQNSSPYTQVSCSRKRKQLPDSRITARNALIRQNFTAFIVTTQNNIKQREKDKKKSLKEQGLLIASEYKKKLEEFTFSLRITVQSNNNQQK